MTLVSPVPTHSPRSARWFLWAGAAVFLSVLAMAAYWGVTRFRSGGSTALEGAKFHAVTPGELTVKVYKDGELQSVNNIDVMCMIEGGSTIVQLVKEGEHVKKGDTIVVLDSSQIRLKIEDTGLELQRAESELTAAKELDQITELQANAAYQAAQVDVDVAKLALRQYTEGTYIQDRDNAETLVRMARINLANKKDDLRQTKELHAKTFVTMADVKAAELAVETIGNELRQAETALRVLNEFTHPMNLAAKNNYVAQTEQKLVQVQKENASNKAKSLADVQAKESALDILKKRYKRMQEQLEYTTIKAPADGLVVYNNQSSFGRGDSAPIQEGTAVRERQVLLRLPDTSAMKAVLRINENQVTKLAPGQRGSVRLSGVRDVIGATVTKISPVSDTSQRWSNPDLREYPVEMALDVTPANLKPGMGVQAEILVDSVADALAVPLTALYTQGADSFVFLRQGDGSVQPKKVAIAQASETHVRLTDGIAPGDQVLLLQPGQGRELLERAGIVPANVEQPLPRGPANANPDGPPRVAQQGGEGGPGADGPPPDGGRGPGRQGQGGPGAGPGAGRTGMGPDGATGAPGGRTRGSRRGGGGPGGAGAPAGPGGAAGGAESGRGPGGEGRRPAGADQPGQ